MSNTEQNAKAQAASLSKQIDAVFALLDAETAKPTDQQDLALIEQCGLQLSQLIAKEKQLSEIADIGIHYPSKPRLFPCPKETRRPRFARLLKVVFVAAMLCVLLFASLTVVAKTNGYSNAFEYLTENIGVFKDMSQGDKLAEDNIVFYKGGEARHYSSLEKALKAEKIDVLYPDPLPDGMKVTSVTYMEENVIEYSLVVIFESGEKLTVSNYYVSDFEKTQAYETITSPDGLVFYLTSGAGTAMQAICQHNGYEYIITGEYDDRILDMIAQLKG